jgi:hypothetical protein
MTVAMSKDVVTELSAGAEISKVGGAKLGHKREVGQTYEMDGEFAVPSVFCMKVQRLK